MKADAIETAVVTGEFSRPQTAFGCSSDFLNNRYVYAVISPRTQGLAIGINVSPEGVCNFQCLGCEVQRQTNTKGPLDLDVMATEFKRTVYLVRSGKIRELPDYRQIAPELLELHTVLLSGNGEPTLAPNFEAVVEKVVHLRAHDHTCNYKLVLPTNGSALDLPAVQEALTFFTKADEIWIKLDGGTQAHITRVNGGNANLKKILSNILLVGRQRPVIIQSMFPCINGADPDKNEVREYLNRLMELKAEGADISMVHVYSSARPAAITSGCTHLPLKTLSRLCQQIKSTTGIRADFF